MDDMFGNWIRGNHSLGSYKIGHSQKD